MSLRARHAGAFVLALSVTMLVMVIGVAGIASLRAATARAVRTDDTIALSHLARSAVDLGVQMLVEYGTWRTGMTNDAWYELGTVDGAKLYMKIVDDDGILFDDAADSFRLYGRATTDNANRMFSVSVTPDSSTGANLLANGDFETGLGGWSVDTGTIEADPSDPAEGLQSLLFKNRNLAKESVGADVSGLVDAATEYQADFWARLSAGTDEVIVRLEFSTGLTTASKSQTVSNVGMTWGQYSVTFPAGAYILHDSAALTFRTSTSPDDLSLDGVVLRETSAARYTIDAGTWRREID